MDGITGDSGEALTLTGPDARFGFHITSTVNNGINFVSVDGAGLLDVQIPSGSLVPEVGITVAGTFVPEPGMALLLTSGLAALAARRRRQGPEA